MLGKDDYQITLIYNLKTHKSSELRVRCVFLVLANELNHIEVLIDLSRESENLHDFEFNENRYSCTRIKKN